MAKAVARAVSVLPFQAIMTRRPMLAGAMGGAMRIGRPLSNRAASSVAMLGACRSRPGRPSTTASKTRPWLPTKVSPGGASAVQRQPGPRLAAGGMLRSCMKRTNRSRARWIAAPSSPSSPTQVSPVTMSTGMYSAKEGRRAKPSITLSNIWLTRTAVSSTDDIRSCGAVGTRSVFMMAPGLPSGRLKDRPDGGACPLVFAGVVKRAGHQRHGAAAQREPPRAFAHRA
jgi:hypothetical protein